MTSSIISDVMCAQSCVGGENAAAPAAQAAQPVQAAAPVVDTVAELQKYKMLLDTGVITEEEFAAKKKQLLGI